VVGRKKKGGERGRYGKSRGGFMERGRGGVSRWGGGGGGKGGGKGGTRNYQGDGRG